MPEDGRTGNAFLDFTTAVNETIMSPITWVRGVVQSSQNKDEDYVWYHRKFRRVPTIDECYTDDIVCFEEANQQFHRDKMVDDEILAILMRRQEECMMREGVDRVRKCAELVEDYENATTNWFSKYGDLGHYRNVRKAFMRQKHRMIWERRHGPIGTGYESKPESLIK